MRGKRGGGLSDRPAARLARIALLGAIGAALAVIESSWPRPLPWVRLGLGHVAVLLALWTDGVPAALGVTVLKLLLAGLVGGTLVQPTTLVSVVASLAAWATMGVVYRLAPEALVGPVGVSVAGAAVYGLVQVWLIGRWLVKSTPWPWAPLVIGPGVLAGAGTGVVAALVLWRLRLWVPKGVDRGEV